MKMKKNTTIFLFLTVLLLSVTACKKDFLDTKPLDEFSNGDTWKDPALIQAYVNGIYSSINNPANGGDGVLKAEFVDEMHDQWYNFRSFHNSLMTPDDNANWFQEDWTKMYKTVRACNMFLENIDKGGANFDTTKVDDKTVKDRMKGEVHFLRAYLYHQLTSLYGGVPIIAKVYGLTDDFNVKRDTYADCVKFIIAELDAAATLLPRVQSGANKGRATLGAALALKARVLLHAASDLHNTAVFPGYAQQELLRYTDGDRAARWTAARDAAKAVMDLGLYGLYKENPAPGDDIVKNLTDLFLLKSTEEDIFVRNYVGKSYENNLALVAGPNGYHLYGEDTPAGEMVDDYEMADGTKFGWNDPVKAKEPYKNREPRFYANILYEGAKFKTRPPDVVGLDPLGVIQVGTWQKWDNASNKMVEVYGIDSRKGPIEDFNGGYTGYYLRKFIDPSVDGQFFGQDVPWRYIRFAEVLLNYAEASIELGFDADARSAINRIRTRAGLPPVTESGAALKQRYRNERRIELAFEEHRFFDVRRWVIGPQVYKQLSGVSVLYKINDDKTTATIPTITPIVVQPSAWLDKSYFFPIIRDEMNKNSLLVQNPGY